MATCMSDNCNPAIVCKACSLEDSEMKSALDIEYDTISQPKCPIFKTKSVSWPFMPMIFA